MRTGVARHEHDPHNGDHEPHRDPPEPHQVPAELVNERLHPADRGAVERARRIKRVHLHPGQERDDHRREQDPAEHIKPAGTPSAPPPPAPRRHAKPGFVSSLRSRAKRAGRARQRAGRGQRRAAVRSIEVHHRV
jgi:hypothetical protein